MIDTKQRTSEILKQIIDRSDGGHISIGEFTKMLGDRSFALMILIFSLPNSFPIPGIPGFSTITGLPITFFGLQMLFGAHSIWLPRKIADKKFSQASMAKILKKALPAVVWIEKFLRPRWFALTSPRGERFLGLLFIALSLIIALPIPGGNFLPGLSMSILAIALLERDGVLAAFGIAFALGSIVFMYQIIHGAFKVAIGWITDWF